MTRPFTGMIEPYAYAPLDEAGRIAGISATGSTARTGR